VSQPAETLRALGFATVVAGVRLPFCVMNASGSAATAAEVRALRRSRTGAIVLKTATVHPFVHPGFRSLHNPGFDKLVPLVRELAAEGERPVVASVAGASAAEMGLLAKAFADAGAAIVEANLADPWIETTLAPFEDPSVLGEVARRLAEAGRPCWVKLPEHAPLPYRTIVATLLDAGVRAVVARNDFHGYEKLLLEAPAPIDVVVVGGIASGFDVATALRKGAKAVQVGAALRAEGPGVFARLEREMRRAIDAGSYG
jgi:dihydroorotate dehydrogenase